MQKLLGENVFASKTLKTILLTTVITVVITNSAPALATPSIIDQLITNVQTDIIDTLIKLFNTTLNIMRVAYIVLAAIGVFLWASGIESYRGRKLIIGAIILAIAVEYLSRVKMPTP